MYGHKLTDDEIAYMSKDDSSLSHPNETVGIAVACYCIAIADLVSGKDNK